MWGAAIPANAARDKMHECYGDILPTVMVKALRCHSAWPLCHSERSEESRLLRLLVQPGT